MKEQVKEQVLSILSEFPQSRNSDKLLQVRVLKDFYNVNFIEDILSPEVPSLETITRHRRKFQEIGIYRSNEQIEKARAAEQAEYIALSNMNKVMIDPIYFVL